MTQSPKDLDKLSLKEALRGYLEYKRYKEKYGEFIEISPAEPKTWWQRLKAKLKKFSEYPITRFNIEEDQMEKYAVVTNFDESLVKEGTLPPCGSDASAVKCPQCKATLNKAALDHPTLRGTFICPNCGSAPFEKR